MKAYSRESGLGRLKPRRAVKIVSAVDDAGRQGYFDRAIAPILEMRLKTAMEAFRVGKLWAGTARAPASGVVKITAPNDEVAEVLQNALNMSQLNGVLDYYALRFGPVQHLKSIPPAVQFEMHMYTTEQEYLGGGWADDDKDEEPADPRSEVKMVADGAVWISIREGVIVGTPFGPEMPDGKYTWTAPLGYGRYTTAPKRKLSEAEWCALLRIAKYEVEYKIEQPITAMSVAMDTLTADGLLIINSNGEWIVTFKGQEYVDLVRNGMQVFSRAGILRVIAVPEEPVPLEELFATPGIHDNEGDDEGEEDEADAVAKP